MATKPYRILSVKTLKAKTYETIDLKEFNELFGTLPTKFVMMLYGESGSGKSVKALQFCQVLANHGKILYNSHEEKDNLTLQDRVNEFNIDHPKLYFGTAIPFENMIEEIMRRHYHYLVIDSVQYMSFTYDQLKELLNVTKRKKKFGIIMVSFGQAKGKPTSAVNHLHASDVKCYFKNGNMNVISRYLKKPVNQKLFNISSSNNNPTLF